MTRMVDVGFVYRGCEFPALQGSYVFGDYRHAEIYVRNSTTWEGAQVSVGDPEVGSYVCTSMSLHVLLSALCNAVNFTD
jgi:hypothetical protein